MNAVGLGLSILERRVGEEAFKMIRVHCTGGQTVDADPDNVRRRVLTSQHYGKLWTGYCDYDQGPGFYYHTRSSSKTTGDIFRFFFQFFTSIISINAFFWDKKQKKVKTRQSFLG